MSTCFEDVEDVDFSANEEFGLDRSELQSIVSGYIKSYFSGKQVPSGADVLSLEYIDMVMSTDICTGVDKAYEAMRACGKFDTSSSEHTISEDIRFVVKTLSQIKRVAPQEYSGGMLLMHLDLLEGVKLSKGT
jgi:hypothetical protein